jgi:hypothetical protein
LQEITSIKNTLINRLADWSMECPDSEQTIPNPSPLFPGWLLSQCQYEACDYAAKNYPDKIVVYIRRQTYIRVPMDLTFPKKIDAYWPGLPPAFNQGIDAAFWRESNSKIYFFRGSKYVRFSNVSAGVDPEYPKPIAGNWPGLPGSFNQGIDAALLRGDNHKIYFFKGSEYVRFSNVSAGVDPEYPKPIAGNWPGLPDSFNQGIDAAFWHQGNNKLYFFKGTEYVRFSDVEKGMDPNYPKSIAWNWPNQDGMDNFFEDGIDAALWRKSNGKIYFFKGDAFGRFSMDCEVVDEGGGGFSHTDLKFVALSSWNPTGTLGVMVVGNDPIPGQAPFAYLAHELGHYFGITHPMPNDCPQDHLGATEQLDEYCRKNYKDHPENVPDNLPDLVWNLDLLTDTPGDPGFILYNRMLFNVKKTEITLTQNACVGAGEFKVRSNFCDREFTVKPARHNLMSYTAQCPYFPGNTTGETRARITAQQRDIILSSLKTCRQNLGRAPYETMWTGTLAKDWSQLMPFVLDGKTHFIAHNSTTGKVNFNCFHQPPDGMSEITGYDILIKSTWGKGWSQLMPFTLNKKPHFIAYNSTTGAVHFDRINDDGKGIVILKKSTWGKGWTQLMPFTLNNKPHFIAYNSTTGAVQFDRINDDGKGVNILKESIWGKGWTQLMPFTLNKKPHFIAYNSTTGAVHFDRISDDGKEIVILKKSNLGKGWTQLLPYSYYDAETKWMLIAHNSASGEMFFYRIHGDGQGVDIRWKENWAPYYSERQIG